MRRSSPSPGVTLYNLEDKAELNPQNLAKLAKEADAGRVVIGV